MSMSFGYGVNSFQSATMSFGYGAGDSHTSNNNSPQLLYPRGDAAPPLPTQKKLDEFLYAIDSATTKLKIPLSAIEPSQALDDDGLVPGLCRLYMEGRCRQSKRCFQVHANPTIVEQLREEAKRQPSCCHFHGAPCTYEGFPLGLTVTVENKEKERPSRNAGGDQSLDDDAESKCLSSNAIFFNDTENSNSILLSLHYLCPTSYLWKQYKQTGSMHLKVPAQKVCRDHLKGLCRFGDECSFLHGCRQSLSGLDEPLTRSMRAHSGADHGAILSFNNSTHERWARGQSFEGSQYPLNSHGHASSLHQSINFIDSIGSSLGSRHMNNSMHPTVGNDEKKEQLLKPLGVRSSIHCSTSSHPSTSFSHNPYAQTSL